MGGRFRDILVDLSLPQLNGLPEQDAAAARADARAFTATAIRLAPHHLRLAVHILTAGLWIWCLPVGGLPARPEGPRWRWAQTFARLPGPPATLFRLYAGLAAFAFFDHPAVAGHLGITPIGQRQETFRKRRAGHE